MCDDIAADEHTPKEMRATLRHGAATARSRARDLVAESARVEGRLRRQQVTYELEVSSRTELRADLAESVVGYARELRDLGAKPEDLVVLIKELADDLPEGRIDDIDGLRRSIVTWSIDAYYDA